MGVRFSLIISLILSIFLLFGASSYAKKIVEVGVICKETKDPSFCSNILNSKPNGAKGADLITLAQYTIDVARANITDTIKLIESLIANASDPSAKDHYEMCLTHFNDDEGALNHIDYTEQMLKSQDYLGLNMAASSVSTDADNCVSGESPSDPVYDDPSLLPKYAKGLEQVMEIILVISNYLMQE